MKMNAHTSTALVAVLIPALLIALPVNMFAEDAAVAAATTAVAAGALKIDTGSPAKFHDSTARGWAWVASQCKVSPISDQCAADSILMASNQCSASAKWFKKDAKSWQYLSFALLIASAGFTGAGALTASYAKVFSTLGGTTGLGAVASSVSANVTSDQAGVASINAALGNFITYVTTGAVKGAATAPIITSPAAASGTVGSAFSYQIGAANSPTSYSATGLPAPLAVSTTGLISGTPASAVTSTVKLGATNAGGTGSATLTLVFAAAGGATLPVITSPAGASGTVGSAFSYQIAATNSPTSYTATGLPATFVVSPAGLISGTPASAGTSTVTLGATNASGSGNATLTLVFASEPPPAAGGPAPNDLIYKIAPIYATQCTAAAMGSSGK